MKPPKNLTTRPTHKGADGDNFYSADTDFQYADGETAGDIPMFDYADGDSDDFGADGDCQIMMNAGGFDDVSTGDMYAEGVYAPIGSNTYIALRNISKWHKHKKRNKLVHTPFSYYTKGEKVTVIGAALKMRGLYGVKNNFFRTSDGHFVLTKELAKDAKLQSSNSSSSDSLSSSDSSGSQRRRRKVEEVTNFRDMQLGEYIVNNTNKGYSDITAFDISDTGRPIKSTGKKIANGSTVSVIEKEKVGENYFFKLSDGKYLSVRAKKHLAKKHSSYNGGSFFRKDGFILWQRDKREPFYVSTKKPTKELQPVRGIEGVWRLKINGGAKKDDFAKLEGYPDFFVLVSDLLNSRKQK